MNNFEFEFFRGNISPVLIYNTWDKFSMKVYNEFIKTYPVENTVDIFEWPEVATLEWLPKYITRAPALVLVKNQKSPLNRVTILDIPSQVMHTVQRFTR